MQTDAKTTAGARLKALFSYVGTTVLDLALPVSCAGCGRDGGALCVECAGAMPRLRQPYCTVCARPGAAGVCYPCLTEPPDFDAIRTPFIHDGVARTLVHRLKYANFRVYAGTMAALMSESLEMEPPNADMVAPVPMHPKRERERGYNQSSLLAKELGRLLGLPVEAKALKKTRNTEPQVALDTADERRRNVAGAFGCAGGVEGKRVLVVDDVVTTGATMSAC
ncbi:MAG: ComF family protein, partial [SAR202 cluster bacterium]|nr:ComF family protein [SAR202 cluster bacterium]